MASHVIPHRGIDYHVTPFVDTDGDVLEVELEYATWRADWSEAIEDLTNLGSKVTGAFWPGEAPREGHRVPSALAALMYGLNDDEIRAAVEEEIRDVSRAVEMETK